MTTPRLLSFSHLIAELNDRHGDNRSNRAKQRLGQHAFNALHDMNPKLANKVRGTDLDPFYNDDRMPMFLAYVQQHWEEYNE